MSDWVDFYLILQVPQSAAQDAVDRAYKAMCKKYHPDVNRSPEAESRMKEINLAYEVLGDTLKRRQYNAQWMLKHSHARTAHNVSPSPPPPPPSDRSADARITAQRYFMYLSNMRYREAYEIISDVDKKNVTREDFAEWQKAVGELYQLHSYQVTGANKDLFSLPDGRRVEAYRCAILVEEEDKKKQKTTKYTLYKHVLWENGRLRVYLGYKDIGNIAEKYRNKAQSAREQKEDDALREEWIKFQRNHDAVTGLLNYEGFLAESGRETYRYDRYGIDCCLMMLRLELPDPVGAASNDLRKAQGEELEKLESHVAASLQEHLRCLDIPSLYAHRHYLCLLSHTNMRGAVRAMKRLKKLIGRDIAANFDLNPRLRMVANAYRGGHMEEAVEKCLSDFVRQEEEEARKN